MQVKNLSMEGAVIVRIIIKQAILIKDLVVLSILKEGFIA